jgi:hypothetical protein
MDLVELAKSLGKDIPDEAMKTIAGMKTKQQVLYYCRRFPTATKAAPKAAPKKAAPKPVKAEEEDE